MPQNMPYTAVPDAATLSDRELAHVRVQQTPHLKRNLSPKCRRASFVWYSSRTCCKARPMCLRAGACSATVYAGPAPAEHVYAKTQPGERCSAAGRTQNALRGGQPPSLLFGKWLQTRRPLWKATTQRAARAREQASNRRAQAPRELQGLGLPGVGEDAGQLMQRQGALERRFAELLAVQSALRQHPSKAAQLANQARWGPN